MSSCHLTRRSNRPPKLSLKLLRNYAPVLAAAVRGVRCQETMAKLPQEVLTSLSDVMFPSDAGEHPVAIDSVGYDGDTPLHVLAWQNDLEGLQILIAAGADLNAQGEMNETPLHIAITQRNIPMIQALLKAGARDDIRCEFGDTAKERAVESGKDMEQHFNNALGT